MNHLTNYLKKEASLFRCFFFAFLIFGLISCNDSDNGTKTTQSPTTDASQQKPQDQTAPKAFLSSGKASYLAIHIDTLRRLFLPPGSGGLNSKKLVFRFTTEGSETSNWVIDGFPTGPNTNNYLNRPPVMLLELNGLNFNLGSVKTYLSDLELTRSQVTTLLTTAGNNTHLIFIPFRNNQSPFKDCISYKLIWGNAQSFTDPGPSFVPSDELNPSPPADPS